jgi:hypothetical protein
MSRREKAFIIASIQEKQKQEAEEEKKIQSKRPRKR